MKMNQIVMSLFTIKHEDYSDMDIDEEEKYPNRISKQVEKDRDNFLQLFKQGLRYDSKKNTKNEEFRCQIQN